MASGTGQYRERIIVQVNTPSVDAEGQAIASWATYKTVWGRVRFVDGRELEGMQKVNARIEAEVTTQYRTDITVLHRLSWRSAFWNIHTILPNENKFSMRLLVSKVE